MPSSEDESIEGWDESLLEQSSTADIVHEAGRTRPMLAHRPIPLAFLPAMLELEHFFFLRPVLHRGGMTEEVVVVVAMLVMLVVVMAMVAILVMTLAVLLPHTHHTLLPPLHIPFDPLSHQSTHPAPLSGILAGFLPEIASEGHHQPGLHLE
jgi:hypothetical protein